MYFVVFLLNYLFANWRYFSYLRVYYYVLKQPLNHIATINSGRFERPEADGDVVYLQVKHFDANGKLESALHPDLSSAVISPEHLLEPGDVLFAAKGSKNFACVYEQHNPPAVASTSFIVIRVTKEAISPEYLSWFLNTPDTLMYLKSQAKGTSIMSISIKVLNELEIPVPDRKTQQMVLNIHQLHQHEKQLKQDIDRLKEQLLQYRLNKAINR